MTGERDESLAGTNEGSGQQIARASHGNPFAPQRCEPFHCL